MASAMSFGGSVLELAGMGCVWHGAAPGLFSQRPPLQSPTNSTWTQTPILACLTFCLFYVALLSVDVIAVSCFEIMLVYSSKRLCVSKIEHRHMLVSTQPTVKIERFLTELFEEPVAECENEVRQTNKQDMNPGKMYLRESENTHTLWL